MKIGILNGPNLGRLGERRPDIYGPASLEDLRQHLVSSFPGVDLAFFQSNHEGALIDQLEAWHSEGRDFLVMNPGALTHQSYALRDAVEGLGLRAVEVHISNIYGREAFRAHSLTAPACLGVIAGLGTEGYRLAVDYLCRVASPSEI